MRIGIDCRMLGWGSSIGRYIQQLVKNLVEIDTENQYVLFLRKDNWNQVAPYQEFEKKNYEQTEVWEEGAIFLPKNFKKVLADVPWYTLAEQIKMPKIIKQEKVDLMHFPHWNVLLFYRRPFIVTIHDLIMFYYPRAEATTLGPVKFWLKDRAHRTLIRHAVRKAKRIIATSEFTKQDLCKTLNVAGEKVEVIYQSPSVSDKKQETRNKKQVLEKYGINKPFVLYVGAAYPHKNLEGLAKAWQIINEKHGDKYHLVFVGRESYFYKRLKESISNFQFPISFTGFIPDDELATLYLNASLYVFPSLYEGFGIPPLEAMSFGLPVVSSNRSCLPEVLGEAALYFDPENHEQIAEAIYRGLTDENIRLELKQKGRENLGRFSGEKLARMTLEIYRS
jgi:glycosyltransferase involved in cell wall biosynthesis